MTNDPVMFHNPLIIGPAPSLTEAWNNTPTRAMHKLGLNTGNMLFAAGIQAALSRGKEKAKVYSVTELEAHRTGADCIVIAAANWLSARSDLENLARQIEASGLPCVMIGIGAQSTSDSLIPELSAGTRRFLSVVSERSHSISTRGTFSAEVCAHYGIRNVEVTGCPSLLMRGATPAPIAAPAGPPRAITISGSRGLADPKQITSRQEGQRLSRLMGRIMLSDTVDFLAQAEMPEINLLCADQFKPEPRQPQWQPFLEEYYGQPLEGLLPVIKSRMKVFFNLKDWLAYLRGRDLMIGTRLHGTIAGLLAGTPSVLITHDSRTAEMAREMAIPSVKSTTITDTIPYEAICETLDFAELDTRHPVYYERFRAFFAANGLSTSL